QAREYGPAEIEILAADTPLFAGIDSLAALPVWMSHGDRIDALPVGWQALARSTNSPYAAMGDAGNGYFGIQFHPEVTHTLHGAEILRTFATDICGATADWTPANFIAETVDAIRRRVDGAHVLCGLSGGVDSSVVAALLHKAVGAQLTCLFVDHGMLRHGEAGQVIDTFA
ncbi:MAG: GMP synthase (glutamine-hydrolyzing), partial [Anaerolineae bacterium]|nr:GMP synthase (glutamine-hydrolyzing) [Anaerolineae bacterium]